MKKIRKEENYIKMKNLSHINSNYIKSIQLKLLPKIKIKIKENVVIFSPFFISMRRFVLPQNPRVCLFYAPSVT